MKFLNDLLKPQGSYVVALSGGPDSVALLHYVRKRFKNVNVIAAHLDHEWRNDSGRDVEFCKQLCEKLGVTFKSQKASTLKFKLKEDGSKESGARQQRRFFLEKLADQFNVDGILLGHHQQDQLETFFIRLIRGTTTAGLCCMNEQTGNYIRPLLNTDKTEILDYLDQHLLSYVKDPTNDSDAFLRNRIRKEVLPTLINCDSRSGEQIIRLISNLKTTENFLEKLTETTYGQLFSDKKLDLKRFNSLDIFLQQRVIRFWLCSEAKDFTLTESFIQEILRFLKHPNGGSHQLGQNWSLVKKQNQATIKQDY